MIDQTISKKIVLNERPLRVERGTRERGTIGVERGTRSMRDGIWGMGGVVDLNSQGGKIL